jgi:hypothetical protein
MVHRGLHFLNARDGIGADHDSEIGQLAPYDFPAIITQQRQRRQAACTRSTSAAIPLADPARPRIAKIGLWPAIEMIAPLDGWTVAIGPLYLAKEKGADGLTRRRHEFYESV